MKLLDKVTREGWVKAFNEGDHIRTTPTCLYGHLSRMEGNEKWFTDRLISLYDAVMALYPERTQTIYAAGWAGTIGLFNDHPDTTFEDVQRVLKFADI